jgi:RNA-directed DNA polymerase
MNLYLSADPATLKEQFYALKSPEDVATMLEVSYSDLIYWIYRTPVCRRYVDFTIKKKSGADRRIAAPTKNIKILQQKMNQVFQAIYAPKYSVHGFVNKRSVRTNAESHIQRRYVFNADLRDFFPTINFGRARGMLMGKPYNRPKRVATVLAHLCCHNGNLPQGAPTSPVISNMLCAQMDSQLQKLASTQRCTYTRYADDITFSTSRKDFPVSIAAINNLNQVEPGPEFKAIVTGNGFCIHPEKLWLRRRNRRQEVTGITVNDFPNLPRRFTNQIRAMLHAWKIYGLEATQCEHYAKYTRKHRAPWKNLTPFQFILKGKIEYLGMIKGKTSREYIQFLQQLRNLDPNLVPEPLSPLEALKSRYHALVTSNDPQARGYSLQDLLRELFKIFSIPMSKPFTRNKGAEQIDGTFELNGWQYLAECRWRDEVANGRDLDGLYGQVDRSGDQAMGVFLSINGWSDSVPTLLKQNRRKSIILINGNDLMAVLNGQLSLQEMLHGKFQSLSQKSEPYCPVDDIMKRKA